MVEREDEKRHRHVEAGRCRKRQHVEELVARLAYAIGMWDILTWHDGTLAIAWWAVIVLIVALLSIGGTAAARRK
jgi:hypothetical protein